MKQYACFLLNIPIISHDIDNWHSKLTERTWCLLSLCECHSWSHFWQREESHSAQYRSAASPHDIHSSACAMRICEHILITKSMQVNLQRTDVIDQGFKLLDCSYGILLWGMLLTDGSARPKCFHRTLKSCMECTPRFLYTLWIFTLYSLLKASYHLESLSY